MTPPSRPALGRGLPSLIPATTSGAGTDTTLAAEVSILDAAAMKERSRIKLPPGSTVVTGVATSPDGRWAYVIHTLGRFNLPITQLERGWVHTYALTILDLSAEKILATLLLDDLTGGSADPWAVVRSRDGKRLWISHSGTHEVTRIDLAKVHDLLQGKVPPDLAKLKDGMRDNIWVQISRDRKLIARLANDLTALYIAGAIRRAPTGGIGPRGLALSPDEKKLFVANYFSGTVAILGADEGKLVGTIPVGPQPAPDAARRGEIYFHDAMRCFQHWHSCATCHPDGRVDALPWDFMRDGIGNPKDVISLVGIMHTSPHNRRATRPDPHECLRTGVIMRCDDASRDFHVDAEVCRSLGLQSIAVVPLRGQFGRVGVLAEVCRGDKDSLSGATIRVARWSLECPSPLNCASSHFLNRSPSHEALCFVLDVGRGFVGRDQCRPRW